MYGDTLGGLEPGSAIGSGAGNCSHVCGTVFGVGSESIGARVYGLGFRYFRANVYTTWAYIERLG